MTLAVDLGRKATKQTKQNKTFAKVPFKGFPLHKGLMTFDFNKQTLGPSVKFVWYFVLVFLLISTFVLLARKQDIVTVYVQSCSQVVQ